MINPNILEQLFFVISIFSFHFENYTVIFFSGKVVVILKINRIAREMFLMEGLIEILKAMKIIIELLDKIVIIEE